MIRLLGAALILSGGLLARQLRLREERARLETVTELLGALQAMGEEIRMCRTPLPELLDRLSRGCGQGLQDCFAQAAGAARRGEDLSGAWFRAVGDLPLPEEAKGAAAKLGKALEGDEEKACKGINLVCCELEKARKSLRENRSDREKQTTAVCLSGAALLVIMLL